MFPYYGIATPCSATALDVLNESLIEIEPVQSQNLMFHCLIPNRQHIPDDEITIRDIKTLLRNRGCKLANNISMETAT